MVPVFAILALSLGERMHVRHFIPLAGFTAGLAFLNLTHVLTMESENLFHRSAHHLASTGSPARYVDVPNSSYSYRSDGSRALTTWATLADSVLYAGTDDSWMYLAWGPRFTRHMEGIRNAAHASEQVVSGRFRFIVMEKEVTPEVAAAIREHAATEGYGILTDAEGRVILVRNPEEVRGTASLRR